MSLLMRLQSVRETTQARIWVLNPPSPAIVGLAFFFPEREHSEPRDVFKVVHSFALGINDRFSDFRVLFGTPTPGKHREITRKSHRIIIGGFRLVKVRLYSRGTTYPPTSAVISFSELG